MLTGAGATAVLPTGFLTIALLVVLEGLLNTEDTMALATLVLGLPKGRRKKALRYVILGAFGIGTLATLVAVCPVRLSVVRLLGAVHLIWLPYRHFFWAGDAQELKNVTAARSWLGLSVLWGTVVRVKLTDIVFAFDSILVAVAMSPRLWVVLTGGILGIIAVHLVIGELPAIVERYPPLVEGACFLVAWVGVKLLVEYLHSTGIIAFEIPKLLSLGLIVVIFAVALTYARMVERRVHTPDVDAQVAELLDRDCAPGDPDE